MDNFLLITILVTICAAFSYINIRFLKLPPTIGLMLIALVSSLVIIVEGKINSGFHIYIENLVKSIDFSSVLLNIMLSFMLFAGSIHVSAKQLKKQRSAVLAFSTLGVAISTFVFGSIIYFVFGLFSEEVNYVYCLLFGALISPTDPIAVLSILKGTKIPQEMEIVISGESLFNDGIGVVFFVTIMEIVKTGVENFSIGAVGVLFAQEVLGGLALGIAISYVAYFFIKKIDHYQTEVLVTLALVMCCDAIARKLHVSAPLAVVAAGLVFGNKVNHAAMSDKAIDYGNKFWELIDDFLNAMLFVLIGLQLVVMPFSMNYLGIGLIAIPILLLARWVSIVLPMAFMKNKELYNLKTAKIITWGGLRGGLSVALALSLPENHYKELIVVVTYVIVIFSIVVQGLTTERLVKSIYK
jgi:CPA1 family monovalent cation:H+ antiporter